MIHSVDLMRQYVAILEDSEDGTADLVGLEEVDAIADLKTLEQPITVFGGSFAYTADMNKDPLTWTASDGSVINPDSLRELGEWMSDSTDWNDFLDGRIDMQTLVDERLIRPSSGGQQAYRDQGDFEYKSMMGD